MDKELREKIDQFPVLVMEQNEVLHMEDSYVREIPILIEGSLKVCKTDESGKEIILYKINPGESCILAITSCINGRKCNATAYVEQKSRIVKIPANLVQDWVNNKSWKQYIFNLYYERFDELIGLIDAIAFKQVDIRLLNKLKEYRDKQGTFIRVTHLELAKEIGSTREVVSRLLKQLEKNGKIKLGRGAIQVKRNLLE